MLVCFPMSHTYKRALFLQHVTAMELPQDNGPNGYQEIGDNHLGPYIETHN